MSTVRFPPLTQKTAIPHVVPPTTTKPVAAATTLELPAVTGSQDAFATGATAAAPTILSKEAVDPARSALAARTAPKTTLSPTQQLNQKIVTKYPGLQAICGDPQALVKDLRARFDAHKAVNPTDPHSFDLSDIGLPLLGQLHDSLGDELQQMEVRIRTLEAQASTWTGAMVLGRTRELADMREGVAYLNELKDDVGTQHKSGAVSYRRTNELGFFVARALGIFDMRDIASRDRALLKVDRYLQGFELGGPNVQEERARYQSNAFAVFDQSSPVPGFAEAEAAFTKGFLNKERLDLISLPVALALGPEPFSRLVPFDIYLMGISKDPAAADGFVRPGGDFWVHDMRHSSAIFHRRQQYDEVHGLSEPQKQQMQEATDRWMVELAAAKSKMTDKELRAAIGFFSFNYHHDRGYPVVPSSFQRDDTLITPKLLYSMLKVSRQPTGFSKPDETIDRAWAWLQDFWATRLPQEQAIIGSVAVPPKPENAADRLR